eukprot:263387_1
MSTQPLIIWMLSLFVCGSVVEDGQRHTRHLISRLSRYDDGETVVNARSIILPKNTSDDNKHEHRHQHNRYNAFQHNALIEPEWGSYLARYSDAETVFNRYPRYTLDSDENNETTQEPWPTKPPTKSPTSFPTKDPTLKPTKKTNTYTYKQTNSQAYKKNQHANQQMNQHTNQQTNLQANQHVTQQINQHFVQLNHRQYPPLHDLQDPQPIEPFPQMLAQGYQI